MSFPDVRIDQLVFSELHIPFKTAFRHASAERAETSGVWIEAVDAGGASGFGESCPRPYVTGETTETARDFAARHDGSIRRSIVNMETLRKWVSAHRDEIDRSPAGWCAIELALLDLFGRRYNAPVEALLGLSPLTGSFQYTAVLGDAPLAAFQAMANQYRAVGFRDYKVKVSGEPERDREKVEVFRRWPAGSIRVRADANNLWRTADDAIAALGRLDYPFFAIEEPIGKDRLAELPRIAESLSTRIVLDESIVRTAQLAQLDEPASQWLLNVRVSKMGGLIRSLEVIDAARRQGLGVIVGAQVGETSVLTRAGLTAASAAGSLLAAREGAFGTHLLERDVCRPPLMFGAGGILEVSAYSALAAPGLGLPIPAGFKP